jgi:hypothetical protein
MPGAVAPAPAFEPESSSLKAMFFVSAASDPGLLPRLLEPFSKLGLVPDRVHADREAHADRVLNVDLRIADVTPRYAHLLEKALRSIVGVRTVIAVRE